MRDSLQFLITSADYQCRSFATGESFLAEVLPPPPCCLLLDLQLEGVNGLEVQNELNARQARMPVLFLSGDDSVARAVSAMRAGAVDFLQKPFDPDLLLNHIGQAVQASTEAGDGRESARHDAAVLAGLSPREHEILTLLVGGDTNKAIARTLDIKVATVESHRRHLMEKFEARTLADLVRVWLDTE